MTAVKLFVCLIFAIGCKSSTTEPTAGSATNPAAPAATIAGSKDASKIDACSLLKPSEIDAALPKIGSPMKDGEGRPRDTWTSCAWHTVQSNVAEVEVEIDPLDQKAFDDDANGPGYEVVPGIGEAAHHGSIRGLLFIKQSGLKIVLRITTIRPKEEQLAAEATLAKTLLGRL